METDTDQPHNTFDEASSRTGRSWLWKGAAIVAIVGTLVFTREPLVPIALLFAIVVPFEKMFPRHKGQKVRREAVGTDIAHALMTPLTGVVSIAVAVPIAIASLIWIPALLVNPLVDMIPPVAMPFVGILLFDFTIYWAHRWSHEVAFFWRFHAIHHSTKTLDWVSGFRNHPLEAAILAPPFVFLVVAGFSAEFAGALAVIQIITGLFLHANVRWRWKAATSHRHHAGVPPLASLEPR